MDAGRTNSEIAKELRIGQNCVKYHLKSIFVKLGIRRRIQAARLARQFALIAPNHSNEEERLIVVAKS